MRPIKLPDAFSRVLGFTLVTGSAMIYAADRAVDVENIIVTATRTETPITAIPNTITILDQTAIEQQIGVSDDLASVLENTVPGFGPSLGKLVGRGESFRGRNPLYMIDGVPQHNALRDGQRDSHTIDLDFIERVEVIHGSNAIQGIGATGGVINLVTKSPSSTGEWTHDLRLSTSFHDSFDGDSNANKVTYLLGKKFDGLDFSAGVAYHTRDLFFDANGEAVGIYPTQGDIMDSDSLDIFIKAGYEFTVDQRLQFMFNDFELERDGDYVVQRGDRTTGQLTTTIPGDPRPQVGDPAENNVTTMSLSYIDKDLFNGSLNAQAYYQDFAGLYEGGVFGGFFRLTPDGPPFLDQSQIESEKYGVKFTYSLTKLDLHGLVPTFGLDINRDATAQVLVHSDREWVPETTLTGYAPFIQINKSFADRWHLSAGYRYEIVELEVDDFTTIAAANSTFVNGGSPTFEEGLVNVGLVFGVTDHLSVFGSFSEGFTMPDVGRVLRGINTPGQNVGDFLDVEPVVTENMEFGVEYVDERFNLHFSYYQSDSDLGSRLDANAEGIFNVRREKTEIEGFEIAAGVTINENIYIGGNYAQLDGEYDSDGNGEVDTDLDGLNIAPDRLNMFIEANAFGWLSGRLQVSHLFDRDFNGPAARPNRDFGGFTIADLFVTANTRLGDIELGIDNLTDNQYLTYFAQTEPFARTDTIFAGRGRTFTLIYRRSF